MTNQTKVQADFNLVLAYLAEKPLEHSFSKTQAEELLILAGNSLPPLTKAAGELIKSGQVKKILLSGGIGHATKFLRENYQKLGYDFSEDLTEAQMNQLYLIEECGVLSEQIILENASTNSGENALNSLAIAREYFGEELPAKILLCNDPLLQRRTKATFDLHWQDTNVQFENFVPLVPQLKEIVPTFLFTNRQLNGLWSSQYFLDLLLGEYVRLKDDATGYGPKGKNFMHEVLLPDNVVEAFRRLSQVYDYNLER